jgi:nucleotide-binding universal stress UspA family protein
MAYAHLLSIASGAPDDADMLTVAADLARRNGAVARVLPAFPTVVAAASWADAFGTTWFTQETWDAIYEAQNDLRAKLIGMARAAAHAADLPFGAQAFGARMEMAEEQGTLWLGLTRELPLTDLVVAGHTAALQDGPWLGLLDEAVIVGRSPLLVARGGIPVSDRPAVVAWDGSMEAGRSVRAAVPLLRSAPRTIILQDVRHIDEAERSHCEPEQLAEYLRLRGVKAVDVERVEGHGKDALASIVRATGAGLLVAGAYGHSRLREALFGGATRSFLEGDEGPHLFLAH